MKPYLLFSALILISGCKPNEEEYPLREAVECNPRGGLPHVISKLEAGNTVRIAYLGGSITEAPGWRVGSRIWLQGQYPDAQIEEIEAAIGGTGSDLGVFRLEQDVLRYKPDLLFVEFAVNDGDASPERIQKAMEGIVRQTWKANPNTDICYVYTLRDTMLSDLQAGKMPRAASAMEALADHYNIPSIHMGVEVAKLQAVGDLIFKAPATKNLETNTPVVFSSDGVHPHVETGHRLYVEAISRSWPTLRKASTVKDPHILQTSLRPDHWEHAKLIPITPDMLSGTWERLAPEHPLTQRFSRNMPVLYKASEPEATLSFSFKGTSAAVFDLLGPDSGEVAIQIDNQPPSTQNRFDAYCTYHRMGTLQVASGLERGTHNVTISLTPKKLEKHTILLEKSLADLEEHPENYAEHNWYAASILILGELTD